MSIAPKAVVSVPFLVIIAGGLAQTDLISSLGPRGTNPMPAPVYPQENPFSESKRILGKVLFWDEQLSSDSTVSCGSCHSNTSGGADPVRARHPGTDGLFNTPDDVFGSFGVVATDASDDYTLDPFYRLTPQAGNRAANPTHMAAYAFELFWDGRATGEFTDPITGEVLIPFGGALESQAVGPFFNPLEMAHADRDWTQLIGKLADAMPLDLATDLTPDLADALADDPSYQDLFTDAFGDPEITPARIAFAIATYERTLVPDQSPWDLVAAGDPDAMTDAQYRGWNTYLGSMCSNCHTEPFFSDFSYKNIGLRPEMEDVGREAVTGSEFDRSMFKVPSWRSVGLKSSYFHTGEFTTVQEVLDFFAGPGDPDNPGRHPFFPIVIPQAEQADLIEFITNGLKDPRAANGEPPFDQPTLHTQKPTPNPRPLGGGTPGLGDFVPLIVADSPPNVGNASFKIGVDWALGGSDAYVAVSSTPPVDGVVPTDTLIGPIALDGAGPGFGFATMHWPIPARPILEGDVVYMQWRIDDPGAIGGVALSDAIELTLFCGGRCANTCPGDIARPFNVLDLADVQGFIGTFMSGDPLADVERPYGVLDLADVQGFIASYAAGCE